MAWRFRRRPPRPVVQGVPYRWQPLVTPTHRSRTWAVVVMVVAIVVAACMFLVSVEELGLALDVPGLSLELLFVAPNLMAVSGIVAFTMFLLARPHERVVMGSFVVAVSLAPVAMWAALRVDARVSRVRCEAPSPYAVACHEYAIALREGVGVTRDPGLARHYLARGCALGDGTTCLRLLRDDPTAVTPQVCESARDECTHGGFDCSRFLAHCPPRGASSDAAPVPRL